MKAIIELDDVPEFQIGQIVRVSFPDSAVMYGKCKSASGWVSVKDRLPDIDGEYMVYGQSEAMRELLPDSDPIWICYYCKEHGFYNIELCREYDYITHWMSLPEPPEEMSGDDALCDAENQNSQFGRTEGKLERTDQAHRAETGC